MRDLEVSGRPVTLVWMRRRMVCGNCASRWLEEHPGFDGRLTRRLAHRLVADAQVMTIRALSRRHGVSWPVINTLVRAWSGLIAEHRRSRRCSVLLVDETSMRKRHRYVTVIVNADTNKTLAMIEHRSSAALSVFLMSQPHRWRRGVKVVVTDGSRAYKASVDACLPHARHMLDRFGVIRWFCAGLTAVRRDIQRRQPDLRADIDRLRRVTTTQAVPVPSPERGSTESLRQRLVAALDEITRLNADNHQIREHLAQQLGHQRHNRISDPSTTCLPHETQAPNHHSAKPSR